MAGSFMKNRKHRSGEILCCLLLAVLINAGWIGTGSGSGEAWLINKSGTINSMLTVDPVRKTEGYSAILYDNRNGLPTSEANAIAQTEEGFIWIGSYAGLIRYDGNHFVRIDSSTGISNVRCLYVDSYDRLWIGTNDSGLFLMERDEVRKWDKKDGLQSLSIRSIAEDEDGILYIIGTTGIDLMDQDMNLSNLKDDRISGQEIREIRRGNDGMIYGLTQDGDLFSIKNREITFFLGHEECRVTNVVSILPDPVRPGNLYLGTEGSRVYYGSLEKRFGSMGVKDISPLVNVNSFEYIDGQIWICAENGIGNLDKEGFSRLGNIPMSNSVEQVITDYEGNLWFASSRQGVMKIVPNRFTDLFERYGLSPAIVNSTCLYNNRMLFMATDSGMIVTDRGTKVDSIPLTKATTASGEKLETTDLVTYLEGVRIRSVYEDSQGHLWIATWRRHGLICYREGEMTVYTTDDGLFSDRVRTVSECEDGSILVANSGGVSIIRDGFITEAYGRENGIEVGEILTVTEGFNGDLLLGSDGGGIYIINGNETKHLGTDDGLLSDIILRIKRSRNGEVCWIVTSNSLAYMTPDYRIMTIKSFPYANNYDLYENSRGDVWVVASNGLYVVSREELLSGESFLPAFYGIAGGLPYTPTVNSFSCLTKDGDLYLSGSSGVVKFNIENSFENLSQIKIVLPYIDIDGERCYPDESGCFSIPRRTEKIMVYPYVFSYSLSELQVTYRLDGFESADNRVSRSSLGPVDYTNLPEGNYQFLISVEDPTGEMSKTVSFRIVKEKNLSDGAAGSIIMDITSLFFLCGILIYTSLYRKRGRLDDRLFFALVIINIILAATELFSFILEDSDILFLRELMYADETVFYTALWLFPYLILLYLDFRACRNTERLRKIKLLYAIPLILFFILLIFNIKTGWIFSVTEENTYLSGSVSMIALVPVILYFAAGLIKAQKINWHLVPLGLLMFGTQILWDFWDAEISSTAFIYTLFLVCVHIHVVNRQTQKEEAP